MLLPATFLPGYFFLQSVAYLPSDEEPEPEPDPESFDIVIFDNHPYDSDNGEHALLKDYLSWQAKALYFTKRFLFYYTIIRRRPTMNSIFPSTPGWRRCLLLKYYNYED